MNCYDYRQRIAAQWFLSNISLDGSPFGISKTLRCCKGGKFALYNYISFWYFQSISNMLYFPGQRSHGFVTTDDDDDEDDKSGLDSFSKE